MQVERVKIREKIFFPTFFAAREEGDGRRNVFDQRCENEILLDPDFDSFKFSHRSTCNASESGSNIFFFYLDVK